MTWEQFEKELPNINGRLRYVEVKEGLYGDRFLKAGTILEILFADQPWIACKHTTEPDIDLIYIRMYHIIRLVQDLPLK